MTTTSVVDPGDNDPVPTGGSTGSGSTGSTSSGSVATGTAASTDTNTGAVRPDDAANAALASQVRRPVTLAFLDLAGDPIRVTNAPYSITPSGTGDPDLDGYTFQALDPRFVSIGPVQAQEGGTETVTLALSGLAVVDSDTMNEIGDKSKWQGRDCRLWRAMLDPTSLQRTGVIWSYFTGYMSSPKVVGDKSSQTIELDVDTYLAFLQQASNRTYLDQASYDPGDLSAQLAISIANGAGNRTY